MSFATHRTAYDRQPSYNDDFSLRSNNEQNDIYSTEDLSYRPDPDVISFVDSTMRPVAEEVMAEQANDSQSTLRYINSQREWLRHTRYVPESGSITASDSGYLLKSTNQSNEPVAVDLLVEAPRKVSFVREWYAELLATGFSILCLAAVIGILFAIHDKPSSSWSFRFSPASVISQLMTLSRSTMMLSTASCISQSIWHRFQQRSRSIDELDLLDRASRGPFGASVLLVKAHRFGLGISLACFITILSLFMGSFTQQVLSYPSRQQPINGGEAAYPIAQTYIPNPGDYVSNGNGPPPTANISMQAAILSSLYGIIGSPGFSCSANSCTWPRAATLGICASCHNVTDTSTQECSPGDSGKTACEYHTPNGLKVTGVKIPGELGWTNVNTTVSNSPYDHFLVGIELNSTLLNLSVYTRPRNSSKPDITECHLEWCAMTYDNASVANTKLNLSLQATHPLRYTGYWENEDGGYPLVFEAGDGFPTDLNATFTIDYFNAAEVYNFLAQTMHASTLLLGYSDSNAISFGAAFLSQPSAEYVVLNMAAGVTDAMRSLAGTQAVGTAWQTVQYTNVHWQWLILPAVVTLLSAVLLGITIVQNRGSQGVIWKSSALALMFHPLTGWDEREIDASSPKTMKKAARGMRGQLKDHGDQGLRIVRT